MNSFKDKLTGVLIWLGILAGCLIPASGSLKAGYLGAQMLFQGESATGVVETVQQQVDYSDTADSNTPSYWAAHYTFEVDGKGYEGGAVVDPGDYSPGKTITVTYLPEDPRTNMGGGTGGALVDLIKSGFVLALFSVAAAFTGWLLLPLPAKKEANAG